MVATDVGGGFSIGLGGLGFVMGLSASWLLFSGLIGAWLAAVFLVPRVKALGDVHVHRSFPDFLAHRFGEPTPSPSGSIKWREGCTPTARSS